MSALTTSVSTTPRANENNNPFALSVVDATDNNAHQVKQLKIDIPDESPNTTDQIEYDEEEYQ